MEGDAGGDKHANAVSVVLYQSQYFLVDQKTVAGEGGEKTWRLSDHCSKLPTQKVLRLSVAPPFLEGPIGPILEGVLIYMRRVFGFIEMVSKPRPLDVCVYAF